MWGRVYVKQKKIRQTGDAFTVQRCMPWGGEWWWYASAFQAGLFVPKLAYEWANPDFFFSFSFSFFFLEFSRAEVPMSIRRILRSRFFFSVPPA